eukprot:Pgem_evm1s14436
MTPEEFVQNRFGNQSIAIQSDLDYASNHANQPVVVDYCLPEEENTSTLNKTGENNERFENYLQSKEITNGPFVSDYYQPISNEENDLSKTDNYYQLQPISNENKIPSKTD